ncbi:hypothetical protein PHYSODRAFT_514063, partial [Phytophthora sojae]
VARWFNELAEFQPQFKWSPGDSNQVSDAVSRNPLFEHNAAQVSLSELIEAARNREIVASVQTTSATVTHSAKQLDDENARLVIPGNEDLKNRVICENHDVVTAGHPGYFKTYVVKHRTRISNCDDIKRHGGRTIGRDQAAGRGSRGSIERSQAIG